jgi:uncharacterized protein (TIGR02679 family)
MAVMTATPRMMTALTEGHQVQVDGLPTGVVAVAAVEHVPHHVEGLRPRRDRRGRPRFDRLFTRLAGPVPADVDDALARAGLTERDARWVLSRPRRGQHARRLHAAATTSGLLRGLWQADTSTARHQLGRLIRLEPRPEAVTMIGRWLAAMASDDEALIELLTSTVPAPARPWAQHEAPRLIAANAPTISERRRLVGQLCALAPALPADAVPLSALAGDRLGDTHGLNPDRPAGRVAARLAAAVAGLPVPVSAEQRREAWEAVGVILDPITSQVAGWRLPLNPSHPAFAVAAAFHAAQQPAVLPIGLLTASSSPLVTPPHPTATIWVVEGMSLLLAAATAMVSVPVVCRAGNPSVAVRRLIGSAAEAGWRIAVSSDFEPGGLHGAITLLALAGERAVPWRLSAADYIASEADAEPFAASAVPDTPWDPRLAAAMRRRQARVSEESRREILLDDLREHGRT